MVGGPVKPWASRVSRCSITKVPVISTVGVASVVEAGAKVLSGPIGVSTTVVGVGGMYCVGVNCSVTVGSPGIEVGVIVGNSTVAVIVSVVVTVAWRLSPPKPTSVMMPHR